MKVIGVEVRFGYSNIPFPKREAKLIPLEIVIPAVDEQRYNEAVGEVTFHTTHGDVTVQTRLPGTLQEPGQPTVRTMQEAQAFLDRQIEAGV
jgi:hypothetical protein